MNRVELSPVEAARFCRKVRIDEHGCWLWTGCLNSKGYACLGVRKQMWLGHRLTYLAALGEFVLVVALLCVALTVALWAMPS